jgi:alpha-L-rhamnosidase
MSKSSAVRVLLDQPVFEHLDKFWMARGKWPAQWIRAANVRAGEPVVMLFRRTFTVDSQQTIRIHVSADERYELFLDGYRIGRGPERGDRLNWFFESYDLTLAPGEHTLVARVWRLGESIPDASAGTIDRATSARDADAPNAQVSIEPAFILCPDDRALDAQLATGVTKWDAMVMECYAHLPKQMMVFCGSRLRVDGGKLPIDFQRGTVEGLSPAVPIGFGYGDRQQTDQPARWILRPALLPPMKRQPVDSTRLGRVVHVESIDRTENLLARPIVSTRNRTIEQQQWQRMWTGKAHHVELPPRTSWRVVIDLENYFCVYPSVSTTGGTGSTIRLSWAESLFESPGPVEGQLGWWHFRNKGDRSAIEGKHFVGNGDEFVVGPEPDHVFDTLWWSAGRYVEVVVHTGDSPLLVNHLLLSETHYPYEWKGAFDCSDARLASVIPMGQRVMEMCSHETYMDCPYYEQLMYVGDTRLEVLVTYTWTGDDRLPRKAIELFEKSRKQPGFTQSRYPSRIQQVIPPFSAWWIAMLHDFMLWRDDRAFVKLMLPGVRGVIDAFETTRTSDGLIAAPNGWNFVDWARGWKNGMPKDADLGISGPINLQLAWVLKQAAELEDYAGEPELAQLQRRRGNELSAACAAFWDASRGLYADDLAKTSFSEHSQCLALLGNSVSESHRDRVVSGLLNDADLTRTTIYFDFYLFETLGRLGRIDRMIDRMSLWFELQKLGFKTTIEAPEPSRSDCHAWGAHPLYHYLATICGIRPAGPGFASVRVAPQLGPLERASGTLCHPRGIVRVDFHRDGESLRGMIELPEGVNGTLEIADQTRPLTSGRNVI